MAGWIKIHRDIAEHWIFQDACKFKWWVDLLLMASFEGNKVLVGDKLIEVKRGQQIISLSFLANRWDTSKRTVLKFLSLLESDGMCNRCTHQRVTILTICNYESYQEIETPRVTDEVTDKYPIGNRLVTELKNVEECKEIYNTPTAHTYTREQDFINQYRKEGRWADACLILHLKSIEECERLFDRWILEYQHKGQMHQDYTDFKGHFIQWARITIAKESRQQNNGNNRPDYSRRGRADVPSDISLDF